MSNENKADDIDAFLVWVEKTQTVATIMSIPGVYEAVSEELNNAWLDYCEEQDAEPTTEDVSPAALAEDILNRGHWHTFGRNL